MATRRFLPDVQRQFASLGTRGERIAVMAGFGSEFNDARYSTHHVHGGEEQSLPGHGAHRSPPAGDRQLSLAHAPRRPARLRVRLAQPRSGAMGFERHAESVAQPGGSPGGVLRGRRNGLLARRFTRSDRRRVGDSTRRQWARLGGAVHRHRQSCGTQARARFRYRAPGPQGGRDGRNATPQRPPAARRVVRQRDQPRRHRASLPAGSLRVHGARFGCRIREDRDATLLHRRRVPPAVPVPGHRVAARRGRRRAVPDRLQRRVAGTRTRTIPDRTSPSSSALRCRRNC